MQSDIVQRLQEKWCGHSGMDESHLVNPDGPEAAAEITRLAEALRAAEERDKALLSALEEWMYRYFWRVDGMPVEAARVHAQSRMKIAALAGAKP